MQPCRNHRRLGNYGILKPVPRKLAQVAPWQVLKLSYVPEGPYRPERKRYSENTQAAVEYYQAYFEWKDRKGKDRAKKKGF